MASRNAHGAKAEQWMEKASVALVATDYGEAERCCMKALAIARAANDFDLMARICLPLQEARRQRRHAACDVPGCRIAGVMPAVDAIASGRWMLEPPLVGMDGRTLRDTAARRGVPVMVLVREPQSRSGRWPIVGVGTGPREPVVVRVQVEPPADPACPDLAWFMAAQEALGDAAIAKAPRNVPADHHVDDMLDLLEAVPDHEKLIQAVAQACREAAGTEPSPLPRRRPIMEDAFSF
ncbi:MAG: hypothetical protein RL689_978 [Planctomycetota bacterium]|jgi:hypothetical protein